MHRTTLAVVVASLLTMPVALASWSTYGSTEPDTQADIDGGFMWTDVPPPGVSNLVYFSVIATFSDGPSPNTALTGSRIEPVGGRDFVGQLGVWADCNHDGYVGMAEGAMREYRVEASQAEGHAIDTQLCPVLSETIRANQGNVHNDGSWITEMIPIGPDPVGMLNPDLRYVADLSAAVWGDHRAPGPVRPPTGCSAEPYVDAFAPGEARHLGGMLHHVDCLDGSLPSATMASLGAADPTGTIAGLGDPAALYAEGGPLDVQTTGTDESCRTGPSGESAGTQPCAYGSNSLVSGESDCASASLFESGPVGDAFQSTWRAVIANDPFGFFNPDYQPVPAMGVHPTGAPQVNPDGSIAATVNETHEESPLDDCNGADDRGNDLYGWEETSAPVKRSADLDFRYAPVGHYTCAGVTTRICGMPTDAGLQPLGQLLGGGYWYAATSGSATAGSAHRGETGQLAVDLLPADVWTFDAHTVPLGMSLPQPIGQVYGTEACPSIGANAGVEAGWDCDPAHWSGTPIGKSYQLRDVDCYDWTVASAGASPTGTPLGPRAVPGISDPAHGC